MRPADLTPIARDVMRRPSGPGLIFATFLIAYLFNSLPWSGWALLARPDLVLVVLVFWAIHQPGSVGHGIAFVLGIAMDVGDSMLLGQHALTYVVAAYLAQMLRVRVLAFAIFEQTLHVLGILVGAAILIVLLNVLLGAPLPGLVAVVSPVLASVAWGPLTWTVQLPALSSPRRDSAA